MYEGNYQRCYSSYDICSSSIIILICTCEVIRMIVVQGREIYDAAIDFDGTLFVEEYPSIGKPKWKVIEYVKYLKDHGVNLILNTNREGKLLEDALKACESVGIVFDAVNENLPYRVEKFGPSRKIGADLYIDDKAINPMDIEVLV